MPKKKKRLWKVRHPSLDTLVQRENVDEQGRLHLSVDPSNLPCDACGKPGPDNRRWALLGDGGNRIGRITPGGTITEFALPTTNSSPDNITAGPDGNLWFTEFLSNKVGWINPGPRGR